MVIITPFIFCIGSLRSYKSIYSENSASYLTKWGTLFSEFKNDKGFWSTQYYLIYFIRRFIFIISQVYLNSFLIIQGCLNISLSLLQLAYIITFRPYKEKNVLFSAFIAEGCVLIANSLVFSLLFSIKEQTKTLMSIEFALVITVFTNIGIQTLLSIFQIILAVKNVIIKVQNFIVKKRYKIREVPEITNYISTTIQTITFNNSIENTKNDKE